MCGNTPWIHNGNRDQKAQMQLSGRIRDNVWSEHAESAPSGMQAAGVNTSTATQNTTAVKRDNVWSEHAETAPSVKRAARRQHEHSHARPQQRYATTRGQSTRNQRRVECMPRDANTNTATQATTAFTKRSWFVSHIRNSEFESVRSRDHCRSDPVQTQSKLQVWIS